MKWYIFKYSYIYLTILYLIIINSKSKELNNKIINSNTNYSNSNITISSNNTNNYTEEQNNTTNNINNTNETEKTNNTSNNTTQEEPDDGSIAIPMTLANISVSYAQNKRYFTIPLQIGTPNQIFNVQIDTSVSTTWVPASKCKNCRKSNNLYKKSISSTSSFTDAETKIEIQDENGNCEGYKVYDTIELSGFKLANFGFVEVTKLSKDFHDHYDGKLGLGNKGQISKEFNFIEKLYYDKLIKKKVFTLTELNETYGLLLIGDLPNHNYKFCNITTETDYLEDKYKYGWMCKITHIFFFNKSNELNNNNKTKKYNLNDTCKLDFDSKVIFDSGYDYISIPVKYIEYFNLNILKLFNQCSTFKNEDYAKDELITICDKKDIDDNLYISFILQGYGYNIQLKNLFVDSNNPYKMEFLIRFNENDEDNEKNIWIFGHVFMREFMIIFNSEDNHIGIYNSKNDKILDFNKQWLKWFGVKINEIRKQHKILNFLLLFFVIILSVVVVLFFIRYLQRKRREEFGPMIGIDTFDPDRQY